MWFVHGARDKWTGPMLYKQQLTADQIILLKKSESKRYDRTDRLVEGIYHRRRGFKEIKAYRAYVYKRTDILVNSYVTIIYLPLISDLMSIMQTLFRGRSDLKRWLNHISKGPKFSA